MTPQRRREFEAEWPELSRRLETWLARRVADRDTRDDVVQETALRLYGCWDRVDRDSSAWPLASTIALNVLRDRARRREPHLMDDPPEAPSSEDVAEVGLARLELARVRRAMEGLTAAQRGVLLAEVGAGGATRDAASKMLRSRARKRLVTLLERVPLVAPFRSGRVSELMQALVGLRDAAVHGVSCLACLIVGVTTVIGASPDLSSPALAAPSHPERSIAGTAAISDAGLLQGPALWPSHPEPDRSWLTDAPSGSGGVGQKDARSGASGSSSGSGGAKGTRSMPGLPSAPAPALPSTATPGSEGFVDVDGGPSTGGEGGRHTPGTPQAPDTPQALLPAGPIDEVVGSPSTDPLDL